MKDAHVEACHVCEIFLSTRPINPYTYTLRIPDEVDGISFPYYILLVITILFGVLRNIPGFEFLISVWLLLNT